MNFVQNIAFSGFRRLVLISSFYSGCSVISNAALFFMWSLNDVPIINLDGFILRVNFRAWGKKRYSSYQLSVKIVFHVHLFNGKSLEMGMYTHPPTPTSTLAPTEANVHTYINYCITCVLPLQASHHCSPLLSW